MRPQEIHADAYLMIVAFVLAGLEEKSWLGNFSVLRSTSNTYQDDAVK